jgi:hypothetical protein
MRLIHDEGAHLYQPVSMPQQLLQIPIRCVRYPDLGHEDLRMAARYQHLSPGFLADAVGGLDTAFAECPPACHRLEDAAGRGNCKCLILFGVPDGI